MPFEAKIGNLASRGLIQDLGKRGGGGCHPSPVVKNGIADITLSFYINYHKKDKVNFDAGRRAFYFKFCKGFLKFH